MDEAAAGLYGGRMTWSHQLAGEVQANHLRRAYCGRPLFLRSQAVLKIPCCQTAQGHRINGVNGCQGTLWSEELDDKELHGALGGECDLEPKGSTVSRTSSTWSTHPSTSTTSVVSHMVLYFFLRTTVLSCILTSVLRTFGFKTICVFQPARRACFQSEC